MKKARTGAARYHFKNQYLIGDGEDDEAHVGKPASQHSRRTGPTEATERPAQVDPARVERRRKLEAEVKEEAVRAGVPLKTAIEKDGFANLSDMPDARLTAYLAKLKKKTASAAEPAKDDPTARVLTDHEAADLRSAIEERGLNVEQELKAKGVESGLTKDATLAVFNQIMSELF
jgi:hypothetical protein